MTRDATRRARPGRTLIVACCACLTGCATRLDPPQRVPVTAQPAPPGWAWPDRNTSTTDRLREDLPDRVPVTRVLLSKLGKISRTVRSKERVIAIEPVGPGLIIETARRSGTRTTLQFVSHDPLLEPDVPDAGPLERLHAITGGHVATLHQPKTTPRGIVVLLHGLGGFPITGRLTHELVDNGWTVLEAWFPLLYADPVRVQVVTDDAPGAAIAGADLAMLVDSHLSEHAYAADAMLEYIKRTTPALSQSPLVLIGFSGGGLILPAIHTRLDDRVDAAIIGYAGTTLPKIGHDSFLTNGGLTVDPRDADDPSQTRERVYTSYRQRSRLDPYNAATLLADKPVLMFHATDDGIVPSASGEELYERLGRPERFTTHAGHRVAVMLLLWELDRICSWLDGQFPPSLTR